MFSLKMNTWFGKCVFKMLIREVDNYPKKTRRNSEKICYLSEAYFEPCQTSQMELFAKALNGLYASVRSSIPHCGITGDQYN